MAPTNANCVHCRSEITNLEEKSQNDTASTKAKESTKPPKLCQRCTKNKEKYGDPTTCSYCQLQAAFVRGKCVYCSHSERKFGPPESCSVCKLKAAFRDKSQKHERKPLCRLCQLSRERNKNRKRKPDTELTKEDDSTNANGNSANSEHSSDASLATRSIFTAARSLPESSSVESQSEQILVIAQLRDELRTAQRQLSQKEALILQRDRRIAQLQAVCLRAEKECRQQLADANRLHHDKQHELQEKIRALIRQVSSLSKGKKPIQTNSTTSFDSVVTNSPLA